MSSHHLSPEASSPAASPQTIFIEHALAVRGDGDALRSQRYLRRATAFRAAAFAGITTGLMLETTVTDELNLDATVTVGLVAIAGLAVTRKFVLAPKEERTSMERYNQPAQDAIGERYELYRPKAEKRHGRLRKPRETVMRWYGASEDAPQNNTDAIDHLSYIATLAKNGEVDKIAIGHQLAKQVDPNIPEPGKKNTMARLLRRVGFRSGGRSKTDKIHIKTPDEWLALAKKERLENGSSLVSMLTKLQDIKFDHPLAKAFRDTGLDEKSLLRTAKTGIDRQLEGVENGRKTRGDAPQKQYVRGLVDASGKNVHTFSNGEYSGSLSFATALGITTEQLYAATANESFDPQGAIRAWEVLIFRRLKELETKPIAQEDAPARPIVDPVAPYQPELIQGELPESTNEPTYLRLNMALRSAAFLTSFVATGVGATLGFDKMTEIYGKKLWAEVNAVAAERGIEEGGGKVLDLAYDPEVGARLGPWQLWGDVLHHAHLLGETLDHKILAINEYPRTRVSVELNRDAAASAGRRTTIDGATDSTLNHPDWFVEGKNMGTTGYWPYLVNNYVHYDAFSDTGDLSWSREEVENEANTRLPPLPRELPANTDRYITVSRNLAYEDMRFVRNYNGAQVGIPVLEGTQPIAVSLDGHTADIWQRPDGTFFVDIPEKHRLGQGNNEGKLRIWLAPTDKPVLPKRSTTTGWIDLTGRGYNANEMDKAWEAIIPNLPKVIGDPAIDEKRSAMIEAYIGEKWSYKLNPWGKGQMEGVDTLPEQTRRANLLAIAQCSIANTQLALENLDYTLVNGYLNKDDGTLSSRDSHAWTVNQKGTKRDATPRYGLTPEDAAYFKEDYSKPEGPTNPWLYGELALLAGGLAVWRRRDIKRAIRAAEVKLAETGQKRLSRIPVADLRLASSIISQVVYAPGVDIGKARVQASYSTETTEVLVNRLLRHNSSMHDKTTQRAVQAAAKYAVDPTDKRLLRQAAAVSRRARRIASHRKV